MKTIILYGRRNVAALCLTYLVAKKYSVKVVSDDSDVLWVAERLGVDIRSFEERGFCHAFICVHGTRILTRQEMVANRFSVNIHPCLEKYKGANPIRRYIQNKDFEGSVSSHYMTEEVDGGKVIHTEFFETPICSSYADFYNVAYVYYLRLLDKTLEKIFQ